VTTVLASPARIAVIEDADRDYGPAEIRDTYIRNADIVLAEGYKINPFPKIEVFRSDLGQERLCGPGDNLLAVAGEEAVESGAPYYDWNDAAGIADLIEARFLARKD
jgi:molybdopterin-guanine dinucleotide biosynthesis protein MobB